MEPQSSLPGSWQQEMAKGKKVHALELFKTSILFLYLWLHWVFLALLGLPLVVASVGFSSSQSACPRRVDSVVVAHRLSCSAACGIFLDQGLNPASAGRFLSAVPPGKSLKLTFKEAPCRTSLVVEWLRLPAPNAWGLGLISVRELDPTCRH